LDEGGQGVRPLRKEHFNFAINIWQVQKKLKDE
jgi:hypothetical protein